MNMLYPLKHFVSSFDCIQWLLLNKAAGATSVTFDPRSPRVSKWPPEMCWQRLTTILIPCTLLARLDVRLGFEGEPSHPPYYTGWTKYVRGGGAWERLTTILPPGSDRFTVTLRNTQRSPERNSDEQVWRDFAKEIGARVIPDYEDKPMSLIERFSIYAGAAMNFGVCNGPMFMCTVSPYPVAMFAAIDAEQMHDKAKIFRGEQYPWALPTHHLIYEKPTLELLMAFFEKNCER